MKKRLSVIIILCVILLLTGCSKSSGEDSKINDLVAEYAAGVLIAYSDSGRYVIKETEKPDETVMPSETESESQTVSEPETTSAGPGTSSGQGDIPEPSTEDKGELDLSELFATSPVQIECMGYNVTQTYNADPEGYFELSAENGYTFVSVNFRLSNNTGEAVVVNTHKPGIILKGVFNKEYRYNNYDASILMNDLTGLRDVQIGAGEYYDAVVIFMIPSDVAENIQSFSIESALDVENDGVLVIR